MANIYPVGPRTGKTSPTPIGAVEQGRVTDRFDRPVGTVSEAGELFDRDGDQVGYVDLASGAVFSGERPDTATPIGKISGDGSISNERGNAFAVVAGVLGSTDQDTFRNGGAAFVVREVRLEGQRNGL